MKNTTQTLYIIYTISHQSLNLEDGFNGGIRLPSFSSSEDGDSSRRENYYAKAAAVLFTACDFPINVNIERSFNILKFTFSKS